jgi:hypothetical protein
MPIMYQDCLIQVASTEITSDITTTSTTFIDLMTLTVTIGANPVILDFSVSCNNTGMFNQCDFQLLVDGGITRGITVYTSTSENASSGAILYKTSALTAGSHTFKIQWRVDAGTGQVRPVTTAVEHAILILEEVTV